MTFALILVADDGTLYFLGVAHSASELRVLHKQAIKRGFAGQFRIAAQLTAPLLRTRPAAVPAPKLKQPGNRRQRRLNDALIDLFGTGDRKRTHDA